MKRIIRWLYFTFVYKQETFAQEILAFAIPERVKDENLSFLLAQINKIQNVDMTLLAGGTGRDIKGFSAVDFKNEK